MNKILLIGIEGVYNYGCEAIVRGSVAILRKYLPSAQIYYASYNYADDKKRLTGCDVTLIKRDRNRFSMFCKYVIRKLLSYIHINYTVPFDSFRWIPANGIDAVFSIGGDMYTLTSNGNYNPALPLFLEQCASHHIKYVLWGASVGPFDSNEAALQFFEQHIKKIYMIVAREENTCKYLAGMGITDNVILAPDPAFFVPTHETETVMKENIIGINLSPLSALYTFGSIEKGLELQAQTLVDILMKTNYRIMFIPHVLSKNNLDNDKWYMEQLLGRLPSELKDRAELIIDDIGFLGVKRFIRRCQLVMAARMHCAINAIEAQVPVLFLSYSDKSKGMAEFVYHSTDVVMKLSDFKGDDAIIQRIDNWNEQSEINKIKAFDYSSILEKLQ